MRRLAWLFLALASCEHEPRREPSAPLPAPSAPVSIAAVDASAPETAPSDAYVSRPSPYAPVAAVLTAPDSVEAFALGAFDFVDVPPNTPRRLVGYPIARRLARPPESFVRAFAALVLADEYRREAVACALSDRHIGFRFTRGADVVEIAILAACPSVTGHSTIAGRTGGQLEGELSNKLAALIRATYPSVFPR